MTTGSISIDQIHLKIQDELDKAKQLKAQAALHEAVAKAFRELIGEVNLADAIAVPTAHTNAQIAKPTPQSQPPVRRIKMPLQKVTVKGLLTQALMQNPDGLTKGQLLEILAEKGKKVDSSNLSSVLSNSPEFVNEKLGPSFFLWRYKAPSQDAATQETEQQGELTSLLSG